MTDKICCNCHYYDGVSASQGIAPCKAKQEMVMWDNTCDHIWLIPERMKVGMKTNADRIRSMSDEELDDWLSYICDAYYMPSSGWLNWLKQEAE